MAGQASQAGLSSSFSLNILNNKEKQIISAIQEYLKQCESGNRHQMTPDIDGILRVLENPEKEG